MDAYGQNNTVYFRFHGAGPRRMGGKLRAGARSPGGRPVIVNAGCTFLIPLTYPGTVEVRTYASKPGRSSVQTHIEMRLVGDERLYAEGRQDCLDGSADGKIGAHARGRALLEAGKLGRKNRFREKTMKKLLCCLAGALALAPSALPPSRDGERRCLRGRAFRALEIAPRRGAGQSPTGNRRDQRRRRPGGRSPAHGAGRRHPPPGAGHRRQKVDAAVTADFVLKTSRDALAAARGEARPVQRIQVGARSVWSHEARLDAEGSRAPGWSSSRGTGLFLLQMVVPAAAFDEAGRAFDQLLPAVKY